MTVIKLNELNYEILQNPAYTSDLSPTDFHFFKHLDHFLLGKTFTNTVDIENAINDFIDSRNSDFFKIGIYFLVDHWQKYIDTAGNYFDQ